MMPAMSPMALRRCLPARPVGRVGLGPDMPRMMWVRLFAEFAPGCLASHCAVRPDAVPTRPR